LLAVEFDPELDFGAGEGINLELETLSPKFSCLETSSRVFAIASPFTRGLFGFSVDSVLISASVLMRLLSTGVGSVSTSCLVSTGSFLMTSSTLICFSRAATTA